MKQYYSHPQAIVESENIGANTRVWAFAHILPGAVLGEDCNVNDHTFIENDVVIGNKVTVKSGVYIWDGVTIHDNVFIGPNVTFTNDLRPRSKQYPSEFLKTVLEEWVSIGANATIIAGNTIGKYAMVGAGSLVTKNIPNNTLWYGNPAKFKSYICNCGEKLNTQLSCPACGKNYSLKDGNIIESDTLLELE
ncbi:transferase [Paenibacillus sp. FSL R7-0273]|uniref:acyltransferase n=1 Tax=Paenibacillus sp. FSL R7-0273 TaxID=1536772 RepID=UPI0004F7B184|nr:acyltransferase [Paenibacillus sp. FSL R7-0273]AIQ49624.1 transferase [Paenibacillus sp. FSL R7-0273]OMF90314.1 N-acetyltransferase [Paenibacillus sp. FSL R7-0273]